MARQSRAGSKSTTALSGLSALDWIAAGLGALVALWLAAAPLWFIPAFVEMFRELGGPLPLLTRVAIQPWAPTLGALLGGGLLLLGLSGRRPVERRRLWIVAAFFGVLAWGTLWGWSLYLPLYELSAAVAG
jgi:hypothetical protein